MSAWRRNALDRLPEYRKLIVAAESPMTLWIELHSAFEEVYCMASPDDSVIRRFYDFARWCRESPGHGGYLSDAGTAAVCAFYEHLPVEIAIRRDLHRWISREEFTSLSAAFRYHLSAAEFTAFESEFIAAKSAFGRPNKAPEPTAGSVSRRGDP